MHEFPHILSGSSTSRGDFVKHDIRKREDQRLTAFKTNKVYELINECTQTLVTPLSLSFSPLLTGKALQTGSGVEEQCTVQGS